MSLTAGTEFAGYTIVRKIGAGGMGRAHAERITTELSGGRIVAVADINLDNAKVVAEPLGAKAYSSGGGRAHC